MEYDYWRYSELISKFVEDARPHPDDLSIGEDISTMPEVKIIFDGFGDLDDEETGEYIEGGNKNMESYAIFIHKNSAEPDFEFPEHDMTPWALIHRPDEEICIWAWHDVENDSWDFSDISDTDSKLGQEVIEKLFDDLYDKYQLDNEEHDEEDDTPVQSSVAWPFPNASKP